jgi:uncharacterized protein (DUF885 family)
MQRLDQVNNVLAKMQEYLPADIVQEIKAAQTQIATARTEMKNATTEEARAEAKQEVKAGRDKLKDAAGKALEYYAQAVANFARIIVQVVKELNQETQSGGSEQEYQLAKQAVEREVYENQGLTHNAATPGTFIDVGSLEEEFTGTATASNLKSFDDKVRDLMSKKRTQLFIKTLMAFVNYYSSEDAVRTKFAKDATINGEVIIKEVLTRLKERQSNEVIVQYVKGYIKTTVTDLAAYLESQ